ASPLRTVVHDLSFQNPIVLAAGTAGYGEELAGVVRLERLGGLVTNAVRREHLPWLARHLPETRKIVNVVGFTVDEYPAVVAGLEEALSASNATAVDAFELNVSCPNTKAGGLEFGADPASLAAVVATVRRETKRPVFVKLSPTLADIGSAA